MRIIMLSSTVKIRATDTSSQATRVGGRRARSGGRGQNDVNLVAPVVLGAIEGLVSSREQLGGGLVTVPGDRAQRTGLPIGHHGSQALSDHANELGRASGQKDREFLAPDPRQEIAGSQLP
jgi:hypothetical protein